MAVRAFVLAELALLSVAPVFVLATLALLSVALALLLIALTLMLLARGSMSVAPVWTRRAPVLLFFLALRGIVWVNWGGN